MEKVILKACIRENFGKNACKCLRKQNQIPAVIYKGGGKSLSVQVGNKDLWHTLHTEAGENVIITMDISGGQKGMEKIVIIKEIQHDPVNEKFLHVDFNEISLKEKLKVKVPIVVKGEAVGVKEEEGVLTQETWEVEVECMPTEIPEHIDVYVDQLKIGDSIHVKDITAPEGDVKILDDLEQIVVSVIPPKLEEELTEEVPAEEAEEPEVIKKGKEDKEEEPEEAEAKEPKGKEAPADKKEEK